MIAIADGTRLTGRVALLKTSWTSSDQNVLKALKAHNRNFMAKRRHGGDMHVSTMSLLLVLNVDVSVSFKAVNHPKNTIE